MVLDDPVFTAFAQVDPDRVVIDLASRPGPLGEPIPVNDGLVKEISLAPYATEAGGEMTRVEVVLDAPADFEAEPDSHIGGMLDPRPVQFCLRRRELLLSRNRWCGSRGTSGRAAFNEPTDGFCTSVPTSSDQDAFERVLLPNEPTVHATNVGLWSCLALE